MFRKALISSLASLLLTACGSYTPAPDVAAFRQVDEQLQAAVDTHCSNVTAMTDAAACAGERDRYGVEAHALVDEMTWMSAAMDDCMMAMGRDNLADMRTTCRSMSDEIATHLGAACTSGDLTQNQAEAARHCNSMRGMVQHELDRSGNMGERGSMMSGMMSDDTCHK